MNWFEEGKEVAELWQESIDLEQPDEEQDAEPECPWPLHTPEGHAWFRGWNSVALDFYGNRKDGDDEPLVLFRPSRFLCGQAFHPEFA